jgi:hypothetical protein
MPLKQGHPANITCLSTPSKPPTQLFLYKNEKLITKKSSLMIVYELDLRTKKNLTKLVYTIDDPDASWNNALVKCEQIYKFANNYHQNVVSRVQVQCKLFLLVSLHFTELILISIQINQECVLNRKIVIH